MKKTMLMTLADEYRKAGNTKIVSILESMDKLFILRLRGMKQDHKMHYTEFGVSVCDCYHPHFPITGCEYARTKKVYGALRRALVGAGYASVADLSDGEIYRKFVLLLLEHAARSLIIKDRREAIVTGMMFPLPKSEHRKGGHKKSKKETK